MKNFLKLFGIIAVVAVIGFSMSSCASTTAGGLFSPDNFYSDSVAVGAIRGEASSMVILGIFGREDFPTVERVARENDITRIATVERFSRPGFLGLWTTYTTIVTGE